MKITLGVCLMLLLSSVVIVTASQPFAGPNYMGFAVNPKDTTVGSSFTTLIWVNVGSAVDTASVDNLTFLPAGKISYVSTAWGNLFAGSIVQLTPEGGGGTINNPVGYAKPITWVYSVSVNGVNRTFATMTWSAVSCGIVTTTITSGGTALSGVDPGTTKYAGTIRVHPMATTAFSATAFNTTDINLAWTKQTGDSKVLIRYKSGSNPTGVTDGTFLYNGTGSSTSQTGLTPGEHVYYSIWGWNDTAGLYSLTYQTDDATTTTPNSPPSLGTPAPTNGSSGQNLALTWSIPINDPDGDLFNWNIACSNGQHTSATGASNGTKSLSLSGLTYSHTYRIWVNVTDPAGSGLYTRSWYQFTTKDNLPPVLGTPTPANGSSGQSLGLTWSISITDPDSDTVSYTIQCSNGQQNSGTGVSGGTKSLTLSGLVYSHTYTVWVNATDSGSGQYTRRWFTFLTGVNLPPNVPDNPIPSNGETDVAPAIGVLYVRVVDPNSDAMSVSFYWGNGTLIGTDIGVVSGQLASISIPDLLENTIYYWYVNASDGHGGQRIGPAAGNWSFTTGVVRAFVQGGGPSDEGLNQNNVLFLVMLENNPVPGAIITVNKGANVQAMGVLVYTATAGADGVYRFKLPNGNYIVTVLAPGADKYQQVFTVQGTTSSVLYLKQTTAADIMPYVLIGVLILVLIGYLFYSGRIGGRKRR